MKYQPGDCPFCGFFRCRCDPGDLEAMFLYFNALENPTPPSPRDVKVATNPTLARLYKRLPKGELPTDKAYRPWGDAYAR